MQNNTTPVATITKPKQITCGINADEKELVKLLSGEFTRTAAVKGAPDVPASEREVLEMALAIATDRRFVTVEVEENFLDIAENPNTGELEEFENTRIVEKVVDLFEEKWEAIKIRDYSTPGTRTNGAVASLTAKLAEAEARLAAMMAAMAATAPV